MFGELVVGDHAIEEVDVEDLIAFIGLEHKGITILRHLHKYMVI